MRVGHTVEDRGFTSPCWIWDGSCNAKGYGRAWGGMAHRVYYRRHVGPVPEGHELDHLCRVRNCVNPDHLEVVTHKENTRRSGAMRTPVHSDPIADEIRQLRRAAGLSQADLADRLGVTQALVSHWERGAVPPPARRLEQVRRDLAEGRGPLPDQRYEPVRRAA